MKTCDRILLTALSAILFTACTSTATATPPAPSGNNPYAVQPGDGSMVRGDVNIASSSIKLAESQPVQVMLDFGYFPPTPCYSLRVETSQPDAQKRININAYGVAEKDKACTLMALATPLQANLNLGTFPKGHYSVWLNGTKVGEFDS